VTEIIQKGLRKVSFASFNHMHSLDLNFHRTSSKNTSFAINRAVNSLEEGLRFSLGFFVPIAAEFVLLSGMLGLYCGP
jgi:ABC-type transport system involved in Fe-S cluster assembly fused permease/ATPase subunit